MQTANEASGEQSSEQIPDESLSSPPHEPRLTEAFVSEVVRLADADRRTVLAVLAGLEPASRVSRRVARVVAELRARGAGPRAA